MSLTIGSRLGPYEILAPLGAGGMGEVYRALDTRLRRDVAIKVLPSHLSSSAEFRQRFEGEARTISQLSHPHVCALYDVGREGETDYLVMEYLVGETLAARLTKGPLPLEQTLRYGTEIADALDVAHRHGIVHRDLKPGNVMLTKSGVKLLDFGLALQRPLDAAGREQTAAGQRPMAEDDVTAPATLTREGAILGTLSYMAPEQLEGKKADARSDIFAFGAVLYEMATGQKAFSGKSQATLISAIMSSEPRPISTIQPMVPPALDRVVKTCLAKEPEERWQSTHDIASLLKWVAQAEPGSDSVPRTGRPKVWRRLGPPVAVVVAVVAISLAALLGRRPTERQPTLHASLLSPDGFHFDLLSGAMALSPDGSRIAFVARKADGKSLLLIRALASPVGEPLAGTEGASYPFWSPDGKFLAFFAQEKVYVIPTAEGGVPEKLTDFGRGRGGTWNREGVILLSRQDSRPLYRFSLSDRVLKPATILDGKRGETRHVMPQFLPDGRHFLYLSQRVNPATQRREDEIYVQSLEPAEKKILLTAASNAVFAPSSVNASDGYLLFRRETNLVAQRFHAADQRLTGDPFVVVKGVAWVVDTSSALFSVSQNGLLAYSRGGVIGLSQLLVCGRDGKQTESLGAAGNLWTPRLSHDGRRVAAEVLDRDSANRDIWIFDSTRLAAPVPVRFTFDPGHELAPVWSPDDGRIAFTLLKNGSWSVMEKTLTGTENLLFSGSADTYLTDWSGDGELLAFNRRSKDGNYDAWVFSLRDRVERVVVQTNADDRDIMFSPDRHWITYMSLESGREEVYVRPFPNPGAKWQISNAGGLQPKWRSDGKELFYLALDGNLMAVPVKTAGAFEAGTPEALFAPRLRRTAIAQYAVFPDGRRFLINALAGDDVASEIQLIQNWKQGRQ